MGSARIPERLRISPRSMALCTCNVLLRYSDSSAGWLNSPNPSAQNPTSTVRMVRMRLMRAKAASIEIGAGFSSSINSPSTSCFSNCPRGGSFMKKATIATITTGIPSRNHAQRQPSVPPAQVAMAAHRTGLASPSPCAPMFIVADIRARMPIG